MQIPDCSGDKCEEEKAPGAMLVEVVIALQTPDIVTALGSRSFLHLAQGHSICPTSISPTLWCIYLIFIMYLFLYV